MKLDLEFIVLFSATASMIIEYISVLSNNSVWRSVVKGDQITSAKLTTDRQTVTYRSIIHAQEP